jgi:hypothetical protein
MTNLEFMQLYIENTPVLTESDKQVLIDTARIDDLFREALAVETE